MKTNVAPESTIRTVDASGKPVPNVPLKQTWKDYWVEREDHDEETATNQDGYATFPSRNIRVTLLIRIIRTITNFNLHGNPGTVAVIYVLEPYKPGTSEPYYSPGRPLAKQIAVRGSGDLP
jgi:hypothetical protein